MPWLTRPLDYIPKRVISLNPSITEFLFVIGAGDRLAGRDVFSYRPRDALKAPHVASFTHADLEALRRLRPDLIVAYYPVQRDVLEPLADIAPVAVVETPTSVDHVVANFKFVAKILDLDEQGGYAAGVYRDLFKGAPVAEEALAIFSLGGYDFACAESFTASALDAVGIKYSRALHCVYHFAGDIASAASILESVDPGLVIYEGKSKEFREGETAWIKASRCRACREGKILATPNDTLAHYGPSLPLDLAKVREALARGDKFVGGTSSIVRPSLSSGWYDPYL